MADEQKIEIVSTYKDLSSAAIKKSFSDSALSAQKFTEEMAKMSNVIKNGMASNQKETSAALNDLSNNLKKASGETKKGNEEFGRFRITTEGFRRSLGAIRNEFLLFQFALRPIINFTKESIEAFAKQEEATIRLNNALKIQGTFSTTLSRQYTDLATSIQSNTKFADEAVTDVIQTFVTLGDIAPEQIGRATQAAIDFASATGKDLPTSAKILSKAAAGFTGELSRYGIVIDRNIPKSEKFAKVLEFIEQRMGGRAQEDVKTFSGRMAQMGNSIDELKEAFGRLLVQRLQLDKYIKVAADFYKAMTPPEETITLVDKLQQQLKELNQEVAKMKKPDFASENLTGDFLLKGLDSGAKAANDTKLAQMERQKHAVEEQIRLEIQLTKQREQSAHEFEAMNTATNQAVVKIRDFEELLSESDNKHAATRVKQINEQFDGFRRVASQRLEMETQLKERIMELDRERAATHDALAKDALKADRDALQTRLSDLEEFGKRAGELDKLRAEKLLEVNSQMTQFMRTWADASTKALEDGFFDVINGKFNELSDVAAAFGETMLRMLLQIAAQQTLMKVFGFNSSLFGLHQGGSVMHGRETSAGYAPQGVPSRFAGRFATGGAVGAILEEGEGVLNRRAMSNLGVENLNKLNRGEGLNNGGVTNNYYIQTIDERSFRDRLSQHTDIYSNASERNITDNRSLRKTIQRFGT